MASFQPGTVVRGVVVRIEAYGAWIRVDGFDGEALVLIPELGWGRYRSVSDVLELGQRIRAVVLLYDPEAPRMSLSIRRLRPDPYEVHAEHLVPGSVLEGRVRFVADYGVFVELFEYVEGLVHVDDLDRPRRVGEPIEVQVVSVDPELRKIRLTTGARARPSEP